MEAWVKLVVVVVVMVVGVAAQAGHRHTLIQSQQVMLTYFLLLKCSRIKSYSTFTLDTEDDLLVIRKIMDPRSCRTVH